MPTKHKIFFCFHKINLVSYTLAFQERQEKEKRIRKRKNQHHSYL